MRATSWLADRSLLAANGFEVSVVSERATFVEAEIQTDGDSVLLDDEDYSSLT